MPISYLLHFNEVGLIVFISLYPVRKWKPLTEKKEQYS